MKNRWALIILIYLITLSLRLFFAYDVPNFTGDESYFTIRQIEHIKDTGLPLVDDDQSMGGRAHIISPFYYYLLAFFNLFLPIELVGKLIPNILSNCVIILSYFIALELTKNSKVAFFISTRAAVRL